MTQICKKEQRACRPTHPPFDEKLNAYECKIIFRLQIPKADSVSSFC